MSLTALHPAFLNMALLTFLARWEHYGLPDSHPTLAQAPDRMEDGERTLTLVFTAMIKGRPRSATLLVDRRPILNHRLQGLQYAGATAAHCMKCYIERGA